MTFKTGQKGNCGKAKAPKSILLNIPRYADTFEPEPEIDIAVVQKEIEQIQTELAETHAKMKGYFKQLGFATRP